MCLLCSKQLPQGLVAGVKLNQSVQEKILLVIYIHRMYWGEATILREGGERGGGEEEEEERGGRRGGRERKIDKWKCVRVQQSQTSGMARQSGWSLQRTFWSLLMERLRASACLVTELQSISTSTSFFMRRSRWDSARFLRKRGRREKGREEKVSREEWRKKKEGGSCLTFDSLYLPWVLSSV